MLNQKTRKMRNILILACLFSTLDVQAQDIKKDSVDKYGRIFSYVEQMPAPGYDLGDFLSKNISYPDSAREHNIEGRVIVKFVVNEEGQISDCKVTKSVNSYLDAEALRVVRAMPPWKPGKQNGKFVKVYYTLPIVYKLTD